MESLVKKVESLNKDSFEEAKNGDLPLVVDFWAEWCGPCKAFAPTFESVAKEFEGKVKFAKLNIEEGDNKELASSLGVMSIPTIVFFNKGQEVSRFSGAASEDQFKEQINDFLKSLE